MKTGFVIDYQLDRELKIAVSFCYLVALQLFTYLFTS